MHEENVTCEGPKQDNHVEIFEAVKSMDSISERLGLLINRVAQGNVDPGAPASQPMPPSPPLQDVLRDCAGDIRARTQCLIDSINELELKLF